LEFNSETDFVAKNDEFKSWLDKWRWIEGN
jgi:translation elongation factor EF-Ts